MKTYIAPNIKSMIVTDFMQNIYDVYSSAQQLGNEGNFDENENSGDVVSTKSVWDN